MKNLKLVLKSIISNDACVQGGRQAPWWISIIMVFVSVVLTLIPPLVSSLKAKGEDFVSASTNNYEVGSLRFFEEANEKGLTFTVNEVNGKKVLEVSKGSLTGEEAFKDVFYNVNSNGVNCYTHYAEDGKIDFQAFYYNGDYSLKDYVNSTNQKKTTFIDEMILSEHYTVEVDGAPKAVAVNRNASFLLLGKYAATGYLYNASGAASKKFSGTYKHFEKGFVLNSLNDNKKTSDTTMASMNAEEYASYRATYFKNFKTFLNTSYKELKVQEVLVKVFTTLGINVGIIVFMGLMLFILTRGKANPYRVYSFFDTQKMAYWATPTMAVLAMIVGFIFSSFAQLAFPLLIGVRIMWMSMKSLNPQSGSTIYSKPSKEEKQKGVKTVKAKSKKR